MPNYKTSVQLIFWTEVLCFLEAELLLFRPSGFIYQIDDRFIGDTTVHGESDLACATVTVAFGSAFQVGLQCP